ncbi:hypothetical protein SAMN05216436_110114 [bacterium A37T11]|nr:hypothetical protein SAMN05216436_110114 [bacterium A37T11]
MRDSVGRDSSSLFLQSGDIHLQLDVLREKRTRGTLQQDQENRTSLQKKAMKPSAGFSWLLWLLPLLLGAAWWGWKKMR